MQEKREKIQKLLALAADKNAPEASLAAKRARELMKRYGISEESLSLFEIEEHDVRIHSSGRMPTWKWDLAETIARYLDLFIMRWSGEGSICVFGDRGDAELFGYVYYVAGRQILEAAKLYKAETKFRGAKRTQAVNHFKRSAVDALGERLSGFRREESYTTALMLAPRRAKGIKQAEEKYDLEYTEGKEVVYLKEASTAGESAAETIDIHTAVKGRKGEERRKLT